MSTPAPDWTHFEPEPVTPERRAETLAAAVETIRRAFEASRKP